MDLRTTPFRFLDLPAELRVKVYECLQQHGRPLYPDKISDCKRQHCRLWPLPLTCRLICREVQQAPEMFVRANTWYFGDRGEFKRCVRNMPAHTLNLVHSIWIDNVRGYHFLQPEFCLYTEDMQLLNSLPRLKRLTLYVDDLAKIPSERSEIWLHTPEDVRHKHYDSAMRAVFDALPRMHKGPVLEIRATVTFKKGGIRTRAGRHGLRGPFTMLFEVVDISLFCRCCTVRGWKHLATVEKQPSWEEGMFSSVGRWVPGVVRHGSRTIFCGSEGAMRLREMPWKHPL